MSDVPAFFVPLATPDAQEAAYVRLAEWCKVPAPALARRIYSIVFKHNGEEWTATVGDTLQGVRHSTHKVRGVRTERSQQLSDPATVTAIFPGAPYRVATNALPGRSAWENPFLAGTPESVVYFTAAK